ncbi:MAG: hypothetical protein MZW92_48475 [Comamonadaceae bacterium]|nr:hypothetical protein [Comamonadaceae bacterium]
MVDTLDTARELRPGRAERRARATSASRRRRAGRTRATATRGRFLVAGQRLDGTDRGADRAVAQHGRARLLPVRAVGAGAAQAALRAPGRRRPRPGADRRGCDAAPCDGAVAGGRHADGVVNRAWIATALAAPTFATAAPTPAMSDDARALVAAVVLADDHGGRPFVVLDKRLARLWVLDGQARVRGSAPVLIGLAWGDDSVPGIGERPLASIGPDERTTPAGRYVLEPGVNTDGEKILWVDYDAAVSMHRVRPTVAAERRLQRLASPTPTDNRISFGCINVPARFYGRVLWPLFTANAGTAYVLPETRTLPEQFPALFGDGPGVY